MKSSEKREEKQTVRTTVILSSALGLEIGYNDIVRRSTAKTSSENKLSDCRHDNYMNMIFVVLSLPKECSLTFMHRWPHASTHERSHENPNVDLPSTGNSKSVKCYGFELLVKIILLGGRSHISGLFRFSDKLAEPVSELASSTSLSTLQGESYAGPLLSLVTSH